MKRFYRVLFGEDIFLSYSRMDAATYAAALGNELSERGFSCFLDQWDTEPGTAIPPRVLRALGRASMLVVIGSLAAARSAAVADEVRLFTSSRRPLVPISIDGAAEHSNWVEVVRGAAITPDTADNLANGTPGAAVTARIEQSARFMKRNARVRRVFVTSSAALVLLMAASGWSAKRALDNAGRALANAAEATRQEQRATQNAARAEQQRAEAQRQAAIADEKRAEAMRQLSNADARRLAADAVRISALEPERGLSLAIQAWRTFDNDASRDALARVVDLTKWMAAIRAEHKSGISDLSFSPDGRYLASVEEDAGKRALLWDLHDLRHRVLVDDTGSLPAVRVSGGGYRTVRFTPGGVFVVASAVTGSEAIDVHDSRQRFRLNGGAFNPASSQLAARSGEYLVFRDERRSYLAYLPLRDDVGQDARDVFFTGDGRYLVAVTDHYIRVWDVSTLRAIDFDDPDLRPRKPPLTLVVDKAAAIKKTDVDLVGQRIAALTGNAVEIWSLTNGEHIRTITAGLDYLLEDVALWPGRDLVVTAGGGGSLGLSERSATSVGTPAITIWDLSTGTAVANLLSSLDRKILAIAFSPDGHWLAAGDRGGRLIVWNLSAAASQAHGIDTGSSQPVAIAAAAGSSLVASASADGSVSLVDLRGGARRRAGRCAGAPAAMTFEPNGQRLFVGTSDGRVCAFDSGSAGLLRSTVLKLSQPLEGLYITPDSRRLYAIEKRAAVHALDAESLTIRGSVFQPNHLGPLISFAFDASSGVVMLNNGVTTTTWDVDNRSVRGTPALGAVERMVFDPRGQQLALRESGTSLLLIDGANLRQLMDGHATVIVSSRALKGHTEPVTSIAYSANADQIATAALRYQRVGEDVLDDLMNPGDKYEIRIWNASTGMQIAPLLTTTVPPRQLAFSGDGRGLLALLADARVVSWNVSPDAWCARAEVLLGERVEPASRQR